MTETWSDVDPELELAPEGFVYLRGSAGRVYLAGTDELAPSFIVRVVTGDRFSIAPRVPREVVAAIPGAPTGSVVWYLGEFGSAARHWRVIVHRPFGPIVEF